MRSCVSRRPPGGACSTTRCSRRFSRSAALDAGWSAEELSEAFAHIAANLFTNYFNHHTGTERDLPAVPELTA